jgi:hypothetical protein
MTATTGRLGGEIIFYDVNDVSAGIAALIANGCEAEIIPHRFDEAGTSAVWVTVAITKCEGDLFDKLQSIVGPLGGDVLEADITTAVNIKRPRLSHIWGREAADHYVEPHWVSQRLFATEDFDRTQVLLDPCTGFGRIADAAKGAGYTVLAADITDRGYVGCQVQDFLERKSVPPSVVGNPPFNVVEAFARRALDLGARKVALLFPNPRLNAAHWLKDLPLRRVRLLTPRPSIPPSYVIARGEKPGGGKVDFCWLIFERGYAGSPEIAWLHRMQPCKT